MGFFDKVKEVGKGALKGALVMAATPYGDVIEGKHKWCKVCMNSTYDTLTFVKLTEIEGEYEIKESIKTFYPGYEDDSTGYHTVVVVFNDGEECTIHLAYDSNSGSGLSSAEARLAAHYKKGAQLVESLSMYTPEISDDAKKWANKILLYGGMKKLF